jgi:hypothetical protein
MRIRSTMLAMSSAILLLSGCGTVEDSPATPELTAPPAAPPSSAPAGTPATAVASPTPADPSQVGEH